MKKTVVLMLILMLALAAFPTTTAEAQGAVVRVVLFYSPQCQFCHEVINNTLLPMESQYGDQLEIVAVNVDEPEGFAIYQAYLTRYNPPSQGWPAVIIQDVVLVGAIDIPGQLPGLVDAGLASGGIDWPEFPELVEAVTGQDWKTNPAGSALLTVSKALTVEGQDTFLARLTTFIMLGAVAFAIVKVFAGKNALFDLDRDQKSALEGWVIPALILVGTAVAGYLAYSHFANTEVVCGPFSGCGIVQASEYSVFLGIPVAALGLAGYLGSAALWGINRYSETRLANTALLLFFSAALAGTIFSIYLTYLEIAVIKAECIWCLASALIFALILAVISSQVPEIASSKRLRSRRGR